MLLYWGTHSSSVWEHFCCALVLLPNSEELFASSCVNPALKIVAGVIEGPCLQKSQIQTTLCSSSEKCTDDDWTEYIVYL